MVNLHELFLELADEMELFFCPALVDRKKKDVEALPDGGLELTLFNGALRTDENVEMARLLRRKSQLLVAFGACAQSGGIPALSNLSSREAHLRTLFGGDERDPARPREEAQVAEGVLRLPRFHETVNRLAAAVRVDYTIPGCPPEPPRIWAALKPILRGEPLPPRGSVLGGGGPTVCAECAREREEKALSGFRRIHELVPDPSRCLLDQGLACAGVATRGGCGALCPAANMPCSGCYGPPDGIYDQPAKLATVLGSVLDVAPLRGLDGRRVVAEAERVLESLPDVAGTVGKYGLAPRPAAVPAGDER